MGLRPLKKTAVTRGSAAALAFALLAFAAGSPASGEEALRVCLDAKVPPWSFHDARQSGGFDAAVADAVAGRLGRKLTLRWFETKLDQDSSTTLGVNALLSDGVCQLVGGYPLFASALGAPEPKIARLPDYEGAKPSDRRRSVALGILVPSHGYQFAAMTIVLGPAAASARITDLADLKGLRLGVESGTLANAVLMLFGDGRYADQITHIVPGRDELLPRLEKGDYDATLVALRRFDAYRAEHPQTKLVPSGYYPPIGFNMGFVGLSTDRDLIEKVNRSINEMLDKGELGALARAAGVTYRPPRQPNVSADITLSDLRRN
jgi:ABC-type amino acid transport substrate-binding protein